MNSKYQILAIVPAMVLGIGMAIPVFAQETSGDGLASTGASIRQAGNDTAGAAKSAYAETVTPVNDTMITTKVKASFVSGKDIRSGDIHVTTTAGVVTLDGPVQNSEIAARAEAIAGNTEGVRGVTNDLRVSPSTSQN
jgi:hyperosmotically inducible periplasmic protein